MPPTAIEMLYTVRIRTTIYYVVLNTTSSRCGLQAITWRLEANRQHCGPGMLLDEIAVLYMPTTILTTDFKPNHRLFQSLTIFFTF